MKLQIFSVLASPSEWEVWGLILSGLFKLDTVSPTALPPLQRFSSVVRSCVGLAAVISPATRLHTLMKYAIIMKIFLKTYLRFLMTLERVNSVMILNIHKIKFLREMSLNLIQNALI